MQVLTARHSDDGKMLLELKNGWYIASARVHGQYLDESYLYYTKKEVLKKFRALIKERRNRLPDFLGRY